MASGVVTLPMGDAQRFDALMSATGLLAAFQGGGNVELTVEAVGEDASVIVAHMPRGRFEPAILGLGAVPFDILVERGYTLVLGSGFVSVFDPVAPLGLLQLDGAVRSELTRHGYTRILGAGNGDLGVVDRRDYHPGLFESAIQIGPGIVQAGKLDILQRERNLPPYIRAFIATCQDRWLAGIAQTPMHLYDLGERLLGYFAAESLACDEVANLSGDREALLAVVSEDRRSIAYFGNPTLPKASIVAFKATRPADAS